MAAILKGYVGSLAGAFGHCLGKNSKTANELVAIFIVAWQADRLLWTIVINDHQVIAANSPAISDCF